MQIIFNHKYGNVEKRDFVYNDIELINVSPEQEQIALSQGWLLHDNKWYQSRSTRLQTKYYTFPEIDINFSITEHCNTDIKNLYDEYICKNNYFNNKEFESDNQRCFWIQAKKDNVLVGFSKMMKYVGGIESVLNAYIIDHLGLDMLHWEAAFARFLNLEYLYIGSGYEKSSIYKSYQPGFEYWTGSFWSNDVKKFRKLCYRDAKDLSIDKLSVL